MHYRTYSEAIESARSLFEDLSFTYPRQWKDSDQQRRVIGFLPIYVPREIIHACGMLPVGIFGAGDRIPVVRGDAYFQSYICHLPRTVIELALNGNLDHFDGFIFPSICDVIRNLSGIFKLQFKDKPARYLDFPQNFDPEIGGVFYRRELERLIDELSALNGRQPDKAALNEAIRLYNRNRRLLQKLDTLRSEKPHLISAVDFYLIRRAGNILSVEDFNALLENVLDLAGDIYAEAEDKIRVVVTGAFCEQPPLGLIRTIENAGCYIVDDDFQLGLTWFSEDIPADSDDPLQTLVDWYLANPNASSAVFEGERSRANALLERVRARQADGVIFCAPSFCDPALLDRPLLERELDKHHIRHTAFQYHENLGQFHVIKEQAGTFADMIKLWE
ncbi:MAG: benzoyl-CoA reductase subunit C [Candidatus Zixiibacteriota bacterium]|nr:MAG: benzoyl-CoA reductase subunit C [candidate division Zixibacteria bacterium]